MKVTVEQILNSKSVLQKLGNQKMSVGAAYKVQRDIKAINPELILIETSLKELASHYTEETKTAYLEEAGKFFKEEIEIEVSKIALSDLNCELTPFEIMSIDFMITE